MQTPSRDQKEAMLGLLDEKIKRLELTAARKDLLQFASRVYPNYSVGAHHKIMAKKFQEIAEGKCKRLIINMPPRHTKSEFASYMQMNISLKTCERVISMQLK